MEFDKAGRLGERGWPRPGIRLPHWEHALQQMSLIPLIQRKQGHQRFTNDIGKLQKVP
jgi:hypothetical protein